MTDQHTPVASIFEASPDAHRFLEETMAQEIANDPELNDMRARYTEIMTELTKLNPGVAPNAQPNPWPTLMRMLFDLPGAPLLGRRLEFERQIWRELIAGMEADLPGVREAIARMRLMAPGQATVSPQPVTGIGRPRGVVHEGRTTHRG